MSSRFKEDTGKTLFLIQMESYSAEDNTWEQRRITKCKNSVVAFKQHYPQTTIITQIRIPLYQDLHFILPHQYDNPRVCLCFTQFTSPASWRLAWRLQRSSLSSWFYLVLSLNALWPVHSTHSHLERCTINPIYITAHNVHLHLLIDYPPFLDEYETSMITRSWIKTSRMLIWSWPN